MDAISAMRMLGVSYPSVEEWVRKNAEMTRPLRLTYYPYMSAAAPIAKAAFDREAVHRHYVVRLNTVMIPPY